MPAFSGKLLSALSLSQGICRRFTFRLFPALPALFFGFTSMYALSGQERQPRTVRLTHDRLAQTYDSAAPLVSGKSERSYVHNPSAAAYPQLEPNRNQLHAFEQLICAFDPLPFGERAVFSPHQDMLLSAYLPAVYRFRDISLEFLRLYTRAPS